MLGVVEFCVKCSPFGVAIHFSLELCLKELAASVFQESFITFV